MKTHKLAGILLVLSFFSVSIFAGGDILVVEDETPEKMKKIRVEVPKMYDLDLSIIDNKGRLIHSEVLEGGELIAKRYNLKQLDEGKYTITTRAAHQKVTKQIMLNKGGIEVLSKETEFDPIFIQEGPYLKINFLNLDGSQVKMSIEDSEKIYLENTYGDMISFTKIIDTGSLLIGDYYLNLQIGDEQHTFYFNTL